MTKMLATQRVNLVCAWAGALIALAYALQGKTVPWLPAAHPSAFVAVLAAIVGTLLCLHYVKLQRWAVTALCFALGWLFTSFSLLLVAVSSSLG